MLGISDKYHGQLILVSSKLTPLHRICNYSAKAILAFCVMNITFPQSYYKLQLLTMGSDCPEPVDNQNSVKLLPKPHNKSN